MKTFFGHITIKEGLTEFGSNAVVKSDSPASAVEILMLNEIECLAIEEEQIEISVQEIPESDYEILKKYLSFYEENT